MQYICSLKAAEKHVSAKIFKEIMYISVKILQICMDLQDSVQRSLHNPAEKNLHICTDSQRSKAWVCMKHGKFRKPACKNCVKHESTHRGDDVTHIDILADLSSIHTGGVKHGRVVVVVQHCYVQFALRRLARG